MAKEVKFNIHLSVSGREGVVAAMRDISVVAQNAVSSIQQLSGVITDWTNAARIQEEAETKLTTVMRQRMSATAEDVAAIKELAAAQQQLGIIGDEVQLSGAQQLATFLNQRAALETLLPAMNNLLAQQRGYNATTSDAVSIGNLLGKVMQGQTGALTRVGITFNDAQEKILKTGDEMQRAATLAEVITANVGEMNAALAATDAGKAKQLSNTIGDLKERLGAMFSQLQPTIVAVGQLGMAISAVASVSSAVRGMAVAFGALSNSATLCALRTKVASAALYGWNKAAVLSRASTIALSRGLTAAGIAARAASIAIRGLYIATGVGAAIAVLTTAIELFTRKTKSAKDELAEFKDVATDLSVDALQTKVNSYRERGLGTLNDSEYKDYINSVSQLSRAKKAENATEVTMPALDTKGTTTTTRDTQAEQLAKYNAGMVTLNSLQAKINDLKAQQGDADMASALALQDQIDALEQQRAMFTQSAEVTPAVTEEEEAGSEPDWLSAYEDGVRNIAAYEAKISDLREQQRTAGSDDYRRIKNEIEALEEEQDAFKGIADEMERMSGIDAFKGVYGSVKGIGSGIEGITTSLEDNEDAWKQVTGVIDGMLSIYDGISQIITIVTTLTKATKGEAAADMMSATAKTQKATASGIAATQGAAEVAVDVSEAVASGAEAAADTTAATAKVFKAHAYLPFVGIALAAGFVGAMIAAIASSSSSIPKFAEGGVVSGATLAMVGEYPGAGSNPEIIAPLDRLRSMLGTSEGGGNISLRVRGRDLVGVLANETRISSKSGRRTNISI